MFNRLNLAALRENLMPRAPRQDVTLRQLADAPNTLFLSRRQMLKLTGMAAVGTVTGLKTTDQGPFEITESRGRIAFKLGGREKWIIDTRRFGGAPKIKFEKSEKHIFLELSGAKYPGTDLPADLVCELRPGIVNWWMTLRLALGDFTSEMPFESWLAGAEPARSKVRMNSTLCSLGTAAGIVLSGKAEAEFYPDWLLRLTGTKIAGIAGIGPELLADSVTISLLTGDKPTIMQKPAAKRTLIEINRGDQHWPLEPHLAAQDGGRIVASGSSFDTVNVEAGESKTGQVYHALVAVSDDDAPRLAFRPGSVLPDRAEQPFDLPLRKARYAIAFDPAGEESALLAEYAQEPVWLSMDSYSLQIGDAPGTVSFELLGRNGKVVQGYCAPALLGMTAPLPDAIAETARFKEDARITLMAIGNPADKANHVNINKTPINLPDHFYVPVIRPKDLLVLTFEFINLRLQGASLSRANTNNPAYIVVHFPPQSIAEEAIYETAEGYKQPDTYPENTRNESTSTTSDKLSNYMPPVQSRISGPSRLAFLVPPATKPIPYTLKDLLDWTKLQPSVALNARPPEADWVSAELSVLQFGAASSDWFNKVAEANLKDQKRLHAPIIPGPPVPSGPAKSGLSAGLIRPVRATSIRGPLRPITPIAPVTPPTVGRDVYTPPTKPGIIPLPDIKPQLPEQDIELEQPVLDITPGLQLPALLGAITEPAPHETAIEMPYRLILSPHQGGAWKHSAEPVNHNNPAEPVELWHTRLAVKDDQGKIDENNKQLRTLRAIWSPDYVAPKQGPAPLHLTNPFKPFRMSLDARDRHEIVRLTSDFSIKNYKPLPIEAERFMLTSLGSWMHTRGAWHPPDNSELEIEAWQHRATMGRDHFVRVVYRGYLFPFGHRASLIKVTERKFQHYDVWGSPSARTAYLRQRMYIVVREPEKLYPKGDDTRSRQIPFRRVLLKTAVTPALNPPEQSAVSSYGQQAFLPRVGDQNFLFQLVAQDWDGRLSEFSAPLIFVGKQYAADKAVLENVYGKYKSVGKCDFFGQKVTYAPRTEKFMTDNTTMETAAITFGAEIPTESFPPGQPGFFPTLVEAEVRLPAVAQLTGAAADNVKFSLHKAYLHSGFNDNNKGSVFAELKGEKPAIAFGSEKTGALVKPNMAINGISRAYGPVGGDLSDLVDGFFKPSKDFFSIDAKLFGGITLQSILPDIPLGDIAADGLTKVPSFNIRYEYAPGDTLLQTPTASIIDYKWAPKLKSNGVFKADEATMEITAELRKNLSKAESSLEVKTKLQNFRLDFENLLFVDFTGLTHHAKSGRKDDIDVKINEVGFAGDLAFLNDLSRFLNKSSDNGPYLDIQPGGIQVGYTLPIPPLTLGMFSLQNIALGVRLAVPFTDKAMSLQFSFCSPENPFLLTVGAFGGGGYFQITFNPSGVEKLAVALEFGACLSLNIGGLASGSIYAMGGISYSFDQTTQQAKIAAYLRMGGSLNVLGLITVSVEFFLQLQYESKSALSPVAKLRGIATLTVKIDIFLFEKTVRLTVEREFIGGDPKFTEVIGPDHWNQYCDAFA